ncbi:unnamed protein product [Prorocentrum cordatum]|uniref:Uncharacterized protein n=1 Tax=Prorocentrum cordatum TaxID=2364126 RepID=A0ABN9XYH9_9DINO|nr:unnamed protein product [Polarella glacialis]
MPTSAPFGDPGAERTQKGRGAPASLRPWPAQSCSDDPSGRAANVQPHHPPLPPSPTVWGGRGGAGGGSRMVLAKTTKSAARMLTLICSLRMCHQATSDDPVSTGIREDTAKRLNQTVALDYAFSSKRDGTSLSKFVQHDRRCLAQKSLRLRTMQEPLAGCHACAEARTSDDLSLSMRGHGDRDPFPGASFSPKGPDSGPPRPQNRGRIRSPGIRGSPMWSTPAPRSRSTSYIYIHSSLPRARGRGQPCLWEDLSRAAGAARPRCQRWALPPSPLARQAPDSGG